MSMLAPTINEGEDFRNDNMTDTFTEERGCAVDSDVDSAAEETTSRGSRSNEAFALGSDVSLMTLLSNRNSLVEQKPSICDQRSVLEMVPSTSNESTTNYEFSTDFSNSSLDPTQQSVLRKGPPFSEDVRQLGVSERNPDTVSPWMRNAGRKKSHPVWDFFRDLRAPDGVGGVVCLHCSWKGDDRSPNNLKTHLKRFHEHDGVYKQFSAKLASTPTQPYVKRNRPTGYSPNASNVNELYMNSAKLAPPNHGLSAVRAALALQQHRNTDDKKTMNFLAMIPRSSEVINITAGFSGEEEGGSSKNGTDNCTIDENGDECGVEMESRNGSGSGEIPTPSTSAQSNNQINAAAILSAAANNPFVYMAAANAIAANGMSSSDKRSTFSLMDGDSVVTLMRVAAELDCTFSFHCRDGQAHFCFETNQTAIDKIRGAEVSLVDVGSEVRVTEWNNGIETDSEMWKKTDWAQFTWAIRGKCQKVLKR